MFLQDTTISLDPIDALLDQAQAIKHRDFHQIKVLGEQAYALAKPLQYWRGMAQGMYYIALSDLRLGDYLKAIAPAKEALWLAREHRLPIEEGYALSGLSAIYGYIGNNDESLDLLLQQLRIAEREQHPELTAFALHDLGTSYSEMKDYAQGIALLERSIDYAVEHDLAHICASSYVNLAAAYGHQRDHETALKWGKAALKESRETQEFDIQLYAYQAVQTAYAALKRYEQAHQVLAEGIALAKSIQSLEITMLLIGLGNLYLQEKNFQAALRTLRQAREGAIQQGSQVLLIDIEQSLAQVYKMMGDYTQAMQHYEHFQAVKDRVFSERSNIRTQILRTLYDLDRLQRENELHQLRSEAAEHELEERKRAEEERIRAERLKAELEKERELSHLKEEILSRISHEFRTPLAIIRTSTDLVTRYGNRISEEQKETHLTRINMQFSVLDKMFEDIAVVMRTNSPAEIHPTMVSLAQLAQQAIRKASQQTNSPDRVVLQIESRAALVRTDAHLVHEIMVNLLTNGLKFSSGEVNLKVEAGDEQVVIEVQDHGIGILDAEREVIFQPLRRGSNIDEVPGSGLGLAFVRNYVTLLDGKIELQSQVGAGTTISVRIPLISA